MNNYNIDGVTQHYPDQKYYITFKQLLEPYEEIGVSWGTLVLTKYNLPFCIQESFWAIGLYKMLPEDLKNNIADNSFSFLKKHFENTLKIYYNYQEITESHNNTFNYPFDTSMLDALSGEHYPHGADLFNQFGTFYYSFLNELELRLKKKQGYIYIIENNGFYKIGRTTDLKNRVKTYYRTENPNPYKLISEYKVLDCISVEKILHKKFEQNNHNREWFKLSAENLKEVEQILKPFIIND